jgi:hypothetical protein
MAYQNILGIFQNNNHNQKRKQDRNGECVKYQLRNRCARPWIPSLVQSTKDAELTILRTSSCSAWKECLDHLAGRTAVMTKMVVFRLSLIPPTIVFVGTWHDPRLGIMEFAQLVHVGVCTASSTIIFPVPGVLTFALTSPWRIQPAVSAYQPPNAKLDEV